METVDLEYYEGLLAEVVREREDYNGMHGIACIEIERLRTALNRIQEVLYPADNAENVDTVGRAREIALAVLNDDEFYSIRAVSNGDSQ